MGFPVAEIEDMPNMARATATPSPSATSAAATSSSTASASACCAIPTRAKPYVLFYTTKRVGGGVQDFDAIKLLRFAV